jgi:hypothetical protein
MKKFSVNCDFGGVKAPFSFYVGRPEASRNPIQHQAEWLAKVRGGTVPEDVMTSLAKLKELADKNGVPFEDLCIYALSTASESLENK